MTYPPLEHNLLKHLADPSKVTPGRQIVKIAVMRNAGALGACLASLIITRCTSEAEARYLGQAIQADVLAHLRHCRNEALPESVVGMEVSDAPADDGGWMAVVTLATASEADATVLAAFLNSYAAVTEPVDAPEAGS